jgi:NAD(P)-dependent dehydrogenase (short-subunit alcohol dehydrogenase family)
VETFGELDALLFMAAATAPPLGSLDVDDAWERSLNVRGFIYCLAAALPAMRERGGGRVIATGRKDETTRAGSRASVADSTNASFAFAPLNELLRPRDGGVKAESPPWAAHRCEPLRFGTRR